MFYNLAEVKRSKSKNDEALTAYKRAAEIDPAWGKPILALARQDPEPIIEALRDTPLLPPGAQWATFLRNHDEIDLSRLTAEQRQEVFEQFGIGWPLTAETEIAWRIHNARSEIGLPDAVGDDAHRDGLFDDQFR